MALRLPHALHERDVHLTAVLAKLQRFRSRMDSLRTRREDPQAACTQLGPLQHDVAKDRGVGHCPDESHSKVG